MKTLAANRPLTQLVVAFAFVSTAEWAYVTALSVHALREDGTIAVGFVGFALLCRCHQQSHRHAVLAGPRRPERAGLDLDGAGPWLASLVAFLSPPEPRSLFSWYCWLWIRLHPASTGRPSRG